MAELKSFDTGVRSRTRKAILDAATGVLATNPAASLSDIATAAGVGRSTLHRYFSERSELIRAVALYVHEMCNAAIDKAEPACGPPLAALRRVVESQLDLGPIVPFVYNEPTILADRELSAILDTGDEAIAEVLARVSARPQTSPPEWPRLVFWALLDAGYEALRRNIAPRVEIVDAIMASLTAGTITPDQS